VQAGTTSYSLEGPESARSSLAGGGAHAFTLPHEQIPRNVLLLAFGLKTWTDTNCSIYRHGGRGLARKYRLSA
jgi:hypothetical protein